MWNSLGDATTENHKSVDLQPCKPEEPEEEAVVKEQHEGVKTAAAKVKTASK